MLSVSSPKGKFKIGDPYEVTSAISLAGPDELRAASSEYPAWVSERYLQLPQDLPLRVRSLAANVVGSIESPYDKAKAIEEIGEHTSELQSRASLVCRLQLE